MYRIARNRFQLPVSRSQVLGQGLVQLIQLYHLLVLLLVGGDVGASRKRGEQLFGFVFPGLGLIAR